MLIEESLGCSKVGGKIHLHCKERLGSLSFTNDGSRNICQPKRNTKRTEMKTSNHFSENAEGSLLIPYQSLQGLPKGETHHTFQREKNVHLTGQYM